MKGTKLFMIAVVEVPRVNANDDQVQLIDIRVSDGQRVEAGDVLMVVETTKAAVDVMAPVAGLIRGVRGSVGDFVDVGAPLCEIVSGAETTPSGPRARPSTGGPDAVVVTAKARKIAVTLGVDIGTVIPVNGRIGEAEVRAAKAAAHGPASGDAGGRDKIAGASNPSAAVARERKANRRAVIVGGGGHASYLVDALRNSGYEIVGCTDTAIPAGHHVCGGVSVIGGEECLETVLDDGVLHAFVGIGGTTSNDLRRAKFEQLLAMGFILPPVIHPSSFIGLDTVVGRGCHVLAGATIGPRCAIGDNVIVNQGAIVTHDCVVEDHVHLTPGSILAGAVTVGTMSVIGMAATVLMRLRIGANCLVHNGAHIAADVADGIVVDAMGRRRKRTD
jgi:sugar O-acyltransferase (sialic acid O-acetyltransferase NeuD family)